MPFEHDAPPPWSPPPKHVWAGRLVYCTFLTLFTAWQVREGSYLAVAVVLGLVALSQLFLWWRSGQGEKRPGGRWFDRRAWARRRS